MTPASAKKRTLTWVHTVDVIGLRFRWTRTARRALADMIELRGSITGLRIEREPDNPADTNALKVSLPARVLEGRQLGYIRATSAELLAPRIDDGILVVSSAKLVSLYAEDDWNSGEMEVRFRDVTSPAAKRAKSKK